MYNMFGLHDMCGQSRGPCVGSAAVRAGARLGEPMRAVGVTETRAAIGADHTDSRVSSADCRLRLLQLPFSEGRGNRGPHLHATHRYI